MIPKLKEMPLLEDVICLIKPQFECGKEIADKYKVSVPQLCIKYTLQLDTISIPKASSKEHIEDNMKLDFEISEEDMVELMKLNRIDYGADAFWPVFNKKNKAN